MTFVYGKTSIERLETAHPDLQKVFRAAMAFQIVDITILCGRRGKDEQDAACAAGKSETPWPTSKHNALPSNAVDAAPYFSDGRKIPWEDRFTWNVFGGIILAAASSLKIPIRWGGDWNGNLSNADQKFHDLPHFELI